MPTNQPVQLRGGRDPFARTTMFRRVATITPISGCSNCGSSRRAGNLFQYGHEHDGLNTEIFWHPGSFCSIECFRSFQPY